MKIIIAPDKFKGSLNSFEVCTAIAEGIKEVDPRITALLFPMADGGDGFAEVLHYYLHTDTIHCNTIDPLNREISATYQWNNEQQTAIIELATATGLLLLK